MAQAEDLNN